MLIKVTISVTIKNQDNSCKAISAYAGGCAHL